LQVLTISKLKSILEKIEAGGEIDIYENDINAIFKHFGDETYYSRDSGRFEVVNKGIEIDDIKIISLN
jgi:hypothetical protein